MRELHACDMENVGTLDISEKTIGIPQDRWWPQTAKEENIG